VLGLICTCVVFVLPNGLLHTITGQQPPPPGMGRVGDLNPPATLAPTVPATSTPSGPHSITGATIGGTRSAFEAAFVAPDQVNGMTPWYRTQSPNSLTVEVCFCSTQLGTDAQLRLALFQAKSAYGMSWTPDDALAVATMFFPLEAKHVRDFTDPTIGLFHVYQSADLAATFPASDFYDSNGGGASPPGTFSIVCGGVCSFALGT
jgi:hypothetical protein